MVGHTKSEPFNSSIRGLNFKWFVSHEFTNW